jgi:CheY-like chemotaxis protein
VSAGRLLVVEDSSEDAALTLAALEEAGFGGSVVLATGGQEALDALTTPAGLDGAGELPAVVLLDLKMPKLDGHQVLERLRQHARTRTTPVVLLTSSRERRDIARSYELGCNGYVVKPLEFGDLVEALRIAAGFWLVVNRPPDQDR